MDSAKKRLNQYYIIFRNYPCIFTFFEAKHLRFK